EGVRLLRSAGRQDHQAVQQRLWIGDREDVGRSTGRRRLPAVPDPLRALPVRAVGRPIDRSPRSARGKADGSIQLPEPGSMITAPRYSSKLSALLVLTCLTARTAVAQDVKKPARPFPGGEKAEIWILAGQSNMGGWGLLKAPIETHPRVMEFKNPNWVLA